MTLRACLLLLTILTVSTDATATHTVYIFLSETCPLSQYYTRTLKDLHKEYASKELAFIGVFPNSLSTRETIQTFKNKYNLPFTCILDGNHTYVRQLNATVTPEAIVTGTSDAIIYRGRIDNTYARVGKKRRVVTHTELADILQTLAKNKTPNIDHTQAIGCLITPKNPEQQ